MDIYKIIENSSMPTLAIIALAIIAKTFYQYVQSKDKEKNDDKDKLEKTYKDIIKKYIEREERYIEIINKFGDELKIVKEYILSIKRKIEKMEVNQ